MKVITFGTLKGGVGKTMSSFNIAGILAEKNKNVLVVDAYSQGNATNNFGVDRTIIKNSINNIFEGKNTSPKEIIIKHPISELKTLDIIPSSIFLFQTEMKMMNLAGRELMLKNYLEDNKKIFNEYDYVIIDTNPSMSIINQNSFLVSDSIILVADVSMNAIEGIELFIALWEDSRKRLRKENNIKAVLINNFDKRLKISIDFIDYCKQHDELKTLLINSIITKNVKLKEAELEAKPINLYDKKSAGYETFRSAIIEMTERGIL